jgi:hypothetical protein
MLGRTTNPNQTTIRGKTQRSNGELGVDASNTLIVIELRCATEGKPHREVGQNDSDEESMMVGGKMSLSQVGVSTINYQHAALFYCDPFV